MTFPPRTAAVKRMTGARPEQAVLSRDTDLSKTEATRAVIEGMVDGLNDHRIDDIGQFFAEGFRWMGNCGCGTKTGLAEFQENWQRPFQAAFADKVCIDEARLYMGEWAAAFGRQEATHAGPFMGIAPTGRRVTIRYMDFWKVEDGKHHRQLGDGRLSRMCWRSSATTCSAARAGRPTTGERRSRRARRKGANRPKARRQEVSHGDRTSEARPPGGRAGRGRLQGPRDRRGDAARDRGGRRCQGARARQ